MWRLMLAKQFLGASDIWRHLSIESVCRNSLKNAAGKKIGTGRRELRKGYQNTCIPSQRQNCFVQGKITSSVKEPTFYPYLFSNRS